MLGDKEDQDGHVDPAKKITNEAELLMHIPAFAYYTEVNEMLSMNMPFSVLNPDQVFLAIRQAAV